MSRAALSLTTTQQERIDRLVRSGHYDGANDVVEQGLRLLEERERQASDFIAGIEDEIEKGLTSGDPTPMETVEELLISFRRAR